MNSELTLIEEVCQRLARALGMPVRPATIGGRAVSVGLLREFPSGSKIHYDEISRECDGLLDEEPVVQLAFNCHLAVPSQGGELVVWKRRWIPADDQYRDGYGWEETVVLDAPYLVGKASLGDGVFFDCRNLHKVSAAVGRRLTLSFFMGFVMSGEIIVWS